MALREIKTFDAAILRKISEPVKQVDDSIRQLLSDLAETMYNTPNGGGLAACQVGILKRLVVIDLGKGLLKLVNPKLVEKKGEQVVIESCLSLPGIWGKLKRPSKVVVQALNENGEKITIRATGGMAKCLCHEIDHLDGVIFTDKVIEYVKWRNN
ncbi:peptide deformylase [Desulforamulus aeronauticus]|uniref:Peptide deformylase n=1 Tax=Desulforamulus aeronauticus DSM 10349 TaxID=1121421 RepID=A0A1M6RJW4_9FIRM|nr:peptide deformylase [Desulforamulus aeronauticus]SHK32742.1 peptide deformylase [Desulforamulus aeronauticus DSM 10349]